MHNEVMKLSRRLWALALLIVATALAITPANGEFFKSLKYGLSFEYPTDLKPDVSDGISLSGPESTAISIIAVLPSRSISTIEDLMSNVETIYQNYDPNLKVLSTTDRKIGTVNAIEKYI